MLTSMRGEPRSVGSGGFRCFGKIQQNHFSFQISRNGKVTSRKGSYPRTSNGDQWRLDRILGQDAATQLLIEMNENFPQGSLSDIYSREEERGMGYLDDDSQDYLQQLPFCNLANSAIFRTVY